MTFGTILSQLYFEVFTTRRRCSNKQCCKFLLISGVVEADDIFSRIPENASYVATCILDYSYMYERVTRGLNNSSKVIDSRPI